MTSDHTHQPDRAARPSNLWWYAITAAILVAIALSNAFSERANYASMGELLPLREPLVWEFSSVFMIGVLLPALAWFYRRIPFRARDWYRVAIVHALATVPFSVIHVAGMVGLRKLAYALAGGSYHFGSALSGWFYEYRKDFVTYWLIVLYLAASSAWRYWRAVHVEREQAALEPAPEPAVAAEPPDRLVVRKLNREFILDTADIARVESDGNYVTVHANGTTYQLRGSLAGMSKRLDARRFVQIHRSQIVNIDHVREIQPWDHGDYRVLLRDGSVVNFSRRYRAQLEQRFNPSAEGRPEGAAQP
jgi:hypothetical protein